MIALPELLDGLRAAVPHQIKEYYWAAQGIYTNPWFWVFTGAILVFEKLLPADKKQRVFSWGLLQDFMWFNADAMLKVALLPAFAGAVKIFYDWVTGDFQLEGPSGWPLWVKIVAAVVVFDFLQWFHHWARHKVKAFWHFHAVHHSAREMNVFTDLRVHAAEYMIAEVLVFVPMFALGLPALAIMGVGSVRWWYTRFIHANIRTSMGPLKHVLVTPQFHRVHHSIEPQHQDKNFGVVFSVWDRMFGTMHPDYDEYPETGVAGFASEPPHRFSPVAWAREYARLFVHPFRELVRRRPAVVTAREPVHGPIPVAPSPLAPAAPPAASRGPTAPTGLA